MGKLNFKVDKNKCIGCGRCISDCSCDVLERDENGLPKVIDGAEERCMKCQHCFAICPTGAISIFGKNPDKSLKNLQNSITRSSFEPYAIKKKYKKIQPRKFEQNDTQRIKKHASLDSDGLQQSFTCIYIH